MADFEIIRNGSGYVDVTAYKAITNYQKEVEKMEYNRGEIYEYEMNNNMGIKKALIVSANFRNGYGYLNIIVLTDEEKRDAYTVPIVCTGMMYADCAMVSFGRKHQLGNYIRTATDAEMKQIDEGIAKCLGIEIEPVYMDSNEEIERLQHELKKCNNIIPVCDNTEELMQAKAEAGIYKNLYEQLLAKMIG